LNSGQCFFQNQQTNQTRWRLPFAIQFYSILSETVGVEVVLKNPLKIPLNLANLLLLWEFTPEDNTDSISNEVSSE